MRYLSLREVLSLYEQIMAATGGAMGIRDLVRLEAAVAQPRMTYGGEELYPTIIEKAAALGFGLIMNHPFMDGNKRVGHAAMESFLVLNGYEISSPSDEQERIILGLAGSQVSRKDFVEWLGENTTPRAESD